MNKTLEDVLLHETEADKYVKIYDSGWLVAMCYVDDEDLFIKYMDSTLLDYRVKDIKLVKDDDFKDKIYHVNL